MSIETTREIVRIEQLGPPETILRTERVAEVIEVEKGPKGPKGDPGPPGALIQELPAGDIDGVNTTFTTSQAYEPGSIMVFLNGVLQDPSDFTEGTSTTIDLAEAPLTGDVVEVVYAVEGSGGGGGGSGIELGTYQLEDYAAVSLKHYDLSGAPGSVPLGALTVAAPNDWIDADANILTPGIYNIVVHLGWTDDPGDGWIYPPTLFNSAQGYAYQAIFAKQALGGDFVTAPDPQALGPDDVPYGLAGTIRFSASVALPTDFTMQIDVYRMAYPE